MTMSRTWLRATSALAVATTALVGLAPLASAADPDPVHSGQYAVTGQLGQTYTGTVQTVTLDAGVTYTMGAWLRGQGTVAITPRNPATGEGLGENQVTLTDEWTWGEYTFTPAETTAYDFRVIDVAWRGAGQVWVDDASLKAAGSDVELLSDPGFEGLGAGASGVWTIDPWTVVSSGSGSTPDPDPDPTGYAHSGDYAVSGAVAGDAGAWPAALAQWVPLTAGTSYTFSAWVRGRGEADLNAQDNVSWGNAVWQGFPLTDTWTQVSATFTPTVSAPHYLRVLAHSADPGDLWVDDLSLTVTGGTTELLTDPGIESDGTWELQSGFTRTYAPVPVTVAHSGTYAIAKTLTGTASWDGPSQYAGLTAGVEYTFGAWLKGSGTVALRSQDTQNGWGDQFWQDVTLTDEWTYYFRTFTAPSTGQFTFALADSTNGTPGQVYADDLTLKANATGAELLTDGGFEDPASTAWWSLGTGWALVSDGGPAGSFTDDDFSLAVETSPNIGIDTSNPANIETDVARATRNSLDDGYLVWHATADITGVSVPVYNWADQQPAHITLAASSDGSTWRDVAIQQYAFVNQTAGNWPLTVTESTDFAAGDRYLRLTISSAGIDGFTQPWATQVARVHVNDRVAAVQASPDAGRIEGAVDVTLSTPTPGATIYYRLGTGNVQTYTGPVHVERGTLSVWAAEPGYTTSIVRDLSYTTTADLTVDQYGQVISADYPGKVTSDDQLQSDVAADEAYYGSLTPPTDRDAHGGLVGSGASLGLQATGYFHVQTVDGKSILVDPEGNATFNLGLDGLGYTGDTYTQVTGREYEYAYLPDPADPSDPLNGAWLESGTTNFSFYVANLIRKNGSFDPETYYQQMVSRAQAWGFNAAGAFSADASYDPGFTNVEFLNLPTAVVPGTSKLYDIYQPGLVDQIDAALAAQLPARADDSSLLGYMFFNEVDYQNLRQKVPAAKASESGTKGALVDFLDERYAGDVAAFDTAWGLSASAFDDLRELSFVPTTDAAVADMDAFTYVYLDKLYGTIATEFRKYDTTHMLIGDRWLANVMNDVKLRQALSTVGGRYLDALTYNYYTYDFDTARIDQMYQWSGGTPFIMSEFHYAEPSHGLITGVRFADDELSQGEMYRNYVEKAAATGEVIGTNWFLAVDQATTGRWYEGYNGEAGGIGLVDVTDRPYKTLLQQMMTTNYEIYDVMLGNRAPYTYTFSPAQGERNSNNTTDIPLASVGEITVDGQLDATWPDGPTLEVNDSGRVLGIAKQGLQADYRLAWDAENLYVYSDVTDDTPEVNTQTGWNVWNGDAIEMFVGPNNVDQGGSIQAADTQLIIKGAPETEGGTTPEVHWYNHNESTQPAVDATIVMTDHGYAIEAAIKLSDLGITDAADGRRVRFDVGFDDASTSTRERQFLWNGVDGNANNRDKWGMATLVTQVAPPEPEPAAPTVTQQPADTLAFAGQSTTLTAAADGWPVPTVQWQQRQGNGGPWSDIAGATDPTLTFQAESKQNARQYRAVFTNASGSVTTGTATLTVRPVGWTPGKGTVKES